MSKRMKGIITVILLLGALAVFLQMILLPIFWFPDAWQGQMVAFEVPHESGAVISITQEWNGDGYLQRIHARKGDLIFEDTLDGDANRIGTWSKPAYHWISHEMLEIDMGDAEPVAININTMWLRDRYGRTRFMGAKMRSGGAEY